MIEWYALGMIKCLDVRIFLQGFVQSSKVNEVVVHNGVEGLLDCPLGELLSIVIEKFYQGRLNSRSEYRGILKQIEIKLKAIVEVIQPNAVLRKISGDFRQVSMKFGKFRNVSLFREFWSECQRHKSSDFQFFPG